MYSAYTAYTSTIMLEFSSLPLSKDQSVHYPEWIPSLATKYQAFKSRFSTLPSLLVWINTAGFGKEVLRIPLDFRCIWWQRRGLTPWTDYILGLGCPLTCEDIWKGNSSPLPSVKLDITWPDTHTYIYIYYVYIYIYVNPQKNIHQEAITSKTSSQIPSIQRAHSYYVYIYIYISFWRFKKEAIMIRLESQGTVGCSLPWWRITPTPLTSKEDRLGTYPKLET